MYPQLRALHTKNAIAFFAQTRAVEAECRLCFRRFKEDGEKIGDFYGKKIKSVGTGVLDCPSHG